MPAESAKVLYVDDEEINLRVFDANFRSRFRLLLAPSGAQALEILAAQGPEIGLLITDQRMPGMTGVEMLERARQAYPEVQRMLVTAYADMDAVAAAVNRGQVMRYVVKPWVKAELAAAIEDALRIRALELELRGVQTQLLQSERLATLGQVSAGLAHELMNPVSYVFQNISALRDDLGVLERYLRTALEDLPDPRVESTLADLPQLLNDVEAGARHIREVAQGVKRQVRGVDDASEARLDHVVEFATKMARAEVGRRARLHIHGDPVKVSGSPVALTQVLLNLLVNAAQAIDRPEGTGTVWIDWRQDGPRVELRVRDNGCGIPPENLTRIFDPLFTTKPNGTGLGLPICRDLVRQHGGDLAVSSTPGEGTTVTVTLKVSAEA